MPKQAKKEKPVDPNSLQPVNKEEFLARKDIPKKWTIAGHVTHERKFTLKAIREKLDGIYNKTGVAWRVYYLPIRSLYVCKMAGHEWWFESREPNDD